MGEKVEGSTPTDHLEKLAGSRSGQHSRRINEIVLGKRRVSTDTALRPARLGGDIRSQDTPTTSTRAPCPGTPASRRSRVTRGASRASARAR